MNPKTALVTGGLAVTVVAVTAAAGPALAASGTNTVTEHFDAKASSSPLFFGKTTFVSTDTDVDSGKTIGHDVLYCTDAGASTTHCHLAFAQKGGILYAQFALSDTTGGLKGTISGGTGTFEKAKGTVTGQAASHTDVKITLHYKK
jgi:hypothetical protein